MTNNGTTRMNQFDPHLHIQAIVIVGLGGTGSQIARSVARMLYDMQQARLQTPHLVMIDPDRVEAKNVGRQLFVEADIGVSKAQVLMRRLNLALGLNCSAIDQPFDPERHLERWGTVVIGAVDNHLARRDLAATDGPVWIDAGNHRSSGQVVIGNASNRETIQRHLDGHEGKYSYLPNAGLLFPALLEPEEKAGVMVPDTSCADGVAQREQDLLVNDWMAVVAAQYVYKLLHRQPITSFVSYISADTLSVRSVPICRAELSAYLNPRSGG